jgi:hypothetical protein
MTSYDIFAVINGLNGAPPMDYFSFKINFSVFENCLNNSVA